MYLTLKKKEVFMYNHVDQFGRCIKKKNKPGMARKVSQTYLYSESKMSDLIEAEHKKMINKDWEVGGTKVLLVK